MTTVELIVEKKKLKKLGWSTTTTNDVLMLSCSNCFFFLFFFFLSAFPSLKIYKATLSFLKSLQINQRFLLRSEMHLPAGIRYLSWYGRNSSGMAGIKSGTKWECTCTCEGARTENFGLRNWLPWFKYLEIQINSFNTNIERCRAKKPKLFLPHRLCREGKIQAR